MFLLILLLSIHHPIRMMLREILCSIPKLLFQVHRFRDVDPSLHSGALVDLVYPFRDLPVAVS